MKKSFFRVLCLSLCFCMLCPVLAALGTQKASAATDERRFIFGALQAENGSSYTATVEAPLSLAISADQNIFDALDVSLAGNTESNALYIALTNHSNASKIEITYGYAVNQSIAYHTVSQELRPNQTESQSFVLPTPLIGQETSSITITFSATDRAVSGTVLLESFFDVSVYTSEEESEATFDTCRFVKETQTVEISGELSYAATSRYADASLELFALDPGEELYLPNKMPVASMNVSLNFSFSVEIEYSELIYSRYVIAAVTKKGERIPLCAPIYPDVPAEAIQQGIGFKGFHTGSLFTVVDSGANIEMVDVYLDRLLGDRDSGILYIGSHSYYHFDEAYIQTLDHRIKNLTGAGCSVYLRFLVSADANDNQADLRDYPYVTDQVEGIVNKGISINSQTDLLTINAFTDFLTARYSDPAQGKISGIILGRKADRASIYGYVGPMSLASYAEQYAISLNVIAGSARKNNPNIQIVVPLSDRMWPNTVMTENLTGDYFAELFLLSLLEVLRTNMLHPPAFCVMVESEAVPDRLGVTGEHTYGTDRLSALLSIIEQYHHYYNFLNSDILYAWSPAASLSDSQLCAAFALQYLELFFQDRVQSFFVDLSLREIEGNTDMAAALQYLVSNIDTAQSDTVIRTALRELGVTHIVDIFPAYTAEKMLKRKVLELRLNDTGYSGEKTVIGSYELWNFSKSTDLLGWYSGNACENLSVMGRALNAKFLPTANGEYADIAYHFTNLTDYSFAPLLRFNLCVKGTDNTPYEIRVCLLGDGVNIAASMVTVTGDARDIYLDLTAYAQDIDALRSIRVMARPLNGDTAAFDLCLHAVYLESTQLDNQALSDRIAASQTNAPTNDRNDRDLTTPILITVLILICSISITAILIVRHQIRKNKKASDKSAHSDHAGDEK
ncbi:MAG: hypothetical protein E7585_00115 [Ruminococcaceae bacterium]|nr:hypothetical protein [Oscillospiraceae bacterium]